MSLNILLTSGQQVHAKIPIIRKYRPNILIDWLLSKLVVSTSKQPSRRSSSGSVAQPPTPGQEC
eukprot:TRINITY_DN424_c0_g1_i4.p1 TRINITY_DN424_c0_g1~~TRINITY_DN424_c0_g1_i4.p1  ORF type:complete len:64 (+),score=1.95 TRINITY_DN424_c0_g1_i4:256-447(+)